MKKSKKNYIAIVLVVLLVKVYVKNCKEKGLTVFNLHTLIPIITRE